MRRLLFFLFLITNVATWGQPSHTLDDDVRTLQVVANGNPLTLPIITLGDDDQKIDIDFDILTHEYKRLTYHIEHCDRNWKTSDLFESDYISGLDHEVIDDYEKSFNTSVLYTHYHLQIPNENTQLLISGNYRVQITDEDDDKVVAEACFMVNEGGAGINGEVTTHTDRDYNGRHQQLSMTINYGGLNVTDPMNELNHVILQNRRWDNRVTDVEANIRTNEAIGFTHRLPLVFEAGNVHHKLEILDKNSAMQGVEHIEFIDPYHHAIMYPWRRPNTYSYDEDNNGAFVIRNTRYGEDNIRSEYMFVHFTFESERLTDKVYLQGDFSHGLLLDENEMQYDSHNQCYELGLLLKQGYYEYRYVHARDSQSAAHTEKTEGNFHETKNEYTILVYHRPRGERYDRLVGYLDIK